MATPKRTLTIITPHPNQTSSESYENQGQGTHIEHQHKIITSKQSTYTPQLPAFTICYFGLVDNLQGDWANMSTSAGQISHLFERTISCSLFANMTR